MLTSIGIAKNLYQPQVSYVRFKQNHDIIKVTKKTHARYMSL